MIHVSFPDGVVESQRRLLLFPGPVVEVVLAEDAREEEIDLCVCQVDAAFGSAPRRFSKPYACMRGVDLPHTIPGAFGKGH